MGPGVHHVPWRWLVLGAFALLWLTPATALADQAPPVLRALDIQLSPAQPVMGEQATLSFQLVDAEGKPVNGAHVQAALRAPVSEYGAPSPPPVVTAWGVMLHDAGHYQIAFPVNFPGRWWLDVTCLGPAGQLGQFSFFLTVTPQFGLPPTSSNMLLFLQSSQRQTFYRIDPVQGSIATFAADAIVRAADHWWAIQRTLTPIAQPDAPPGVQAWHLTLIITDLQTGKILPPIPLDTAPTGMQEGSSNLPALAFAVTGDPQRPKLYLYWAWAIDHQWRGRLGIVSLERAMLGFTTAVGGALSGSYLFVQLDTSPDSQILTVVEHTVALGGTDVSRLSSFETQGLTLLASKSLQDDGTATTCLFSTLGINGLTREPPVRWFSLCPLTGDQFALVLWNIETAEPALTRTLMAAADSTITLDASQHRLLLLDQHRPAVLTSINLATGTVVYPVTQTGTRETSLLTRITRWLLDWLERSAVAQTVPAFWAALAPDSNWLYTVVPTIQDQRVGDGIWVLNANTFEVVDHWLPGYRIAGVAVARNGIPLAIVRDRENDRLVLLDQTQGTPRLILQLPGHVAGIAAL